MVINTTTAPGTKRRASVPTLELLALVLLLAVLGRPALAALVDQPAVQTWSTMFVSITVQALPFLTLGVVVSGAIAAFVSTAWVARELPKSDLLAVPAAGLLGLALPGCECGSVPIAGRLAERGVRPSAALAFMLSAPAINPVVLVATAVAFPFQPLMVVARLVASLATSVIVGLLWSRLGRADWMERARSRVVEGETRWQTFSATARHDFLHAGGWLVVGAMAAATLQALVPRTVLDTLAANEVAAVAALAALAFVLAICSEADAFVAASLNQFSLTSRLVFLVVGPAVDIKLVALQVGTFGRRFALRFAPLTMLVAVVCALVTGMVVR